MKKNCSGKVLDLFMFYKHPKNQERPTSVARVMDNKSFASSEVPAIINLSPSYTHKFLGKRMPVPESGRLTEHSYNKNIPVFYVCRAQLSDL
jgi:hypothetical protein